MTTQSVMEFYKLASSSIATPAAGTMALYLDSATPELKTKDESAVFKTIVEPSAGTATPSATAAAGAVGTSIKFMRQDAVIPHGTQTTDTMHALAVAATSHGFLDKADKTKLDSLATLPALPVTLTSQIQASNTNADTDILVMSVSANALAAGSTFRVVVYGSSDNSSTGGTINFWIKVDGTKIVTLSLATPASSQTSKGFEFNGLVTFRTIGASGSVFGGMALSSSAPTGTTQDAIANSSGTTVDTTATVTITAGFNWSAAVSGNILNANLASINPVK